LNIEPVGAIHIPARHTASLQPGDTHVMFHGLKRPLEQWGEYSLTFHLPRRVKPGATRSAQQFGHGLPRWPRHYGAWHGGKPSHDGTNECHADGCTHG
jgi:hypothetical protein